MWVCGLNGSIGSEVVGGLGSLGSIGEGTHILVSTEWKGLKRTSQGGV